MIKIKNTDTQARDNVCVSTSMYIKLTIILLK